MVLELRCLTGNLLGNDGNARESVRVSVIFCPHLIRSALRDAGELGWYHEAMLSSLWVIFIHGRKAFFIVNRNLRGCDCVELVKNIDVAEDNIIELRDMGKVFSGTNGPITALSHIDLQIKRGEIFGIIGMSGAGKSTLVRCINLLEKPTSGQVILNGKDLTVLPAAELRLARQSMGMIFQQFNLLMQRTALANVCFPLEIAGIKGAEAKKRAQELLKIVGLSDRMDSYPSQLSGGQKQRVAIARALATNPKVLLCDEATSALDPNTTRGVLELLQDINKRLGITIVIITHEMSVIEEVCQRVAIISESEIAELGAVSDIFARPKSDAARTLVFHEGRKREAFDASITKCIRIVFNGGTVFEPILGDMMLECQSVVNILYANTRNIEGKVHGQMIVQLPSDERLANKMLGYLQNKDVTLEEVEYA